MKIGSLFAGIGGFELGLSQGIPGARVAWQVEIDPWCRGILAHHWPDAARHDDVREVGARNLEPVDVLCGGFPCQDISTAGAGAGLAGARSGLWFEMLRVIRELRPAYVVAENVAALRSRGLPVVLDGLREAGYSATWSIIAASDLGAPHQRRRMWILACRSDVPQVMIPVVGEADLDECLRDVWPRGGDPEPWERGEPRAQPATLKIPDRSHRLRALGNAVVPQIPRIIGRAIAAGDAFALHGCAAAAETRYPTPTAEDGEGHASPGNLRRTLTLRTIGAWGWPAYPTTTVAERDNAGGAKTWPTPTVCGNHNRVGVSAKSGDGLATAVARSAWPTPTAHLAKECGSISEYQRNEASLTAQAIGDPTTPGRLNPAWVELLMGYPRGWTHPRAE
jgi:DNA (cytosine-5)-methyltransferase 1